MVDNLRPPFQGTGDTTPNVATDDVGGVHFQKMKVDGGGDGVSLPIIAGQQTMANSFPVVVASNQTSLPVTATLSGTGSVNVAQVNGVTIDTGSGNGSSGTIRVYLATDQPVTTTALKVGGNVASGAADSGNPNKVGGRFNSTPPTFTDGQRGDLQITSNGSLKTDASATTQPVSGTVSITANSAVNVAQFGGTNTVTGTGASGAGIPRVTIANDSNVLATQSGSWTATVTQATASNLNATVVGTGTLAVQDSQVITDNAAFTDGTSKLFMGGFIFDETAGTALTENDAAAARVDSKRAIVGVLEDATTRGQRAAVSAAGRLSVDASGVAVPVTDNAGSLTVDAPVGTPVATRLSDGAAFLTTTSGRLAVDPSGVTSPVSIAAAVTEKFDVVTAVTASWTSATSVDTTAQITVTNYATVLLSINPTTTFTAGAINFEISDDAGTTWYPIQGARLDSFTTETSYTIVASTKRTWQFDVSAATTFRVRLNPAITGSGTLALRMQASAAPSEPAVTIGGTLNIATAAGKTPAFAKVDVASSGDNQIVAADATRKIKVVSYVLVGASAVNVKWRSATTDLTGAMPFAANGGVSAIGTYPSHLLETVANQALNLNLSGAFQVSGHISYFLET